MKTAPTLALAFAFLAAPSAAQVPADPAPVAQAAQVLVSRSDDVARVLRGEADASSTFGPQFLAQVSSERLTALMRSLETQYGAFIGVG